ncbi:hypothetical protein JMJ35_006641 [Cladonia borealis]|uniref:Protein kinase domain-containing protein n=1 Tax=Cladonia borealis TaxID=184061 RepID=A0AA39QZF4_9LECA|nr:hypothetical protein JMJ35_006641 [Cladonia borealis]
MTTIFEKRKSLIALEEVTGSRPASSPDPQTQKARLRSRGRTETRKDAAVLAGRKGRLSLYRREYNRGDAPVELLLPKLVVTRLRAHEYVFDHLTIVATPKALPCEPVVVEDLPYPDSHTKLEILQWVRHENLVVPNHSFAVVEYVPVSLGRIATSHPYATEHELAAILGQILKGLAYIVSHGLVHSSLDSSNVFIDTDGAVKIGEPPLTPSPDPTTLRG